MITAVLWPNLRKHFVSEFDQFEEHQTQTADGSIRLFSVENLAAFDGIQNKQLYLSILGSVYDVSKGLKHYGPGGTYNFFVGE